LKPLSFIAAVALVAVAAPAAQAHARLEVSNPGPSAVVGTAPTEVRLRFNEPVLPPLTSVSVVGPDRRTAPATDHAAMGHSPAPGVAPMGGDDAAMDHSAMPGMDRATAPPAAPGAHAGMDHGGGSTAAAQALASSTPANGAVLDAAPGDLTLRFAHAMTLESLRLTAATGERVPVTFDQTASEVAQVRLPSLIDDDYQAAWSARGTDGHLMSGVVNFTVR